MQSMFENATKSFHLFIAIFCLSIGLAACKKTSGAPANTSKRQIKPRTPSIKTMGLADILKDQKADRKGFYRRYDGKVIRIKGKVLNAFLSGSESYVHLNTKPDSGAVKGKLYFPFLCVFKMPNARALAAGVYRDQVIELEGAFRKGRGFLRRYRFEVSRIVTAVKPFQPPKLASGPIKLSLEKVGGMMRKNALAASLTYQKKTVQLSGAIKRLHLVSTRPVQPSLSVELFVASASNFYASCHLQSSFVSWKRDLRLLQKIVVRGVVKRIAGLSIRLEKCEILTPRKTLKGGASRGWRKRNRRAVKKARWLMDSFRKDKKALSQKVQGKTLRVSGELSVVSYDPKTKQIRSIIGFSLSLKGVMCVSPPQKDSFIRRLEVGLPISVKGTLMTSGYSMMPTLEGCTFVR